MDIQKISDKIYANVDDRERMEQMNELYYEMANYLKDNSPSVYERFRDEAEGILYSLTEDEAYNIVRSMLPYGEHWSMNDVNNYVQTMGEEPCLDWYLCMNMAFNDYSEIAHKYGIEVADFCYDIAKAFICDKDAKPYKVARYFNM